MTIQVPFRLRRRDRVEPATALLFSSGEPSEVFAACSSLGVDPCGRLYGVARGLLLELGRPTTERLPGAIRLRALADAFYVPVDAELVPALLGDEASGLVRDWGLVFLPGNRALLFDRNAPVALTELLCGRPRAGRAWSALPEPRELADRLVEIALELPEPSAAALYDSYKRGGRSTGGQVGPADPGEVAGPDPAAAPERAPSDSDSTLALSAGRSDSSLAATALTGLGSVAHALQSILGHAGKTLAGLREKAQWDWIDQSALLSKLVREFREGDPERALRRAVPISSSGDSRRQRPAGGLPWKKPIYSLAELLRRPRRGEPTSVFLAQPAVVQLLVQEYHRAAQRACASGDFRRAAYIYGVLLRDDRLAASALQRGGLHHDAAILYLQKLNDTAAAVQAFEAAGAVDRAIALLRQLGRHEAAGDLLRRIGEEEEAVREYVIAADLLAATRPPDHLAAGRILLEKARRPDMASDQFQTGWQRRPEGNAALCALELARQHAERGAMGPIRKLLDEADQLYDVPGRPYDGFFFNEMTRLAMLPSMASAADELRDRTLQSLARKLRAGVAGSQSAPALVSALLGRSALWPAPVVSDAEFAAAAELKRSRGRAKTATDAPRVAGVQIGRGTVSAVCHAERSGELFIGFERGFVLAYRPDRDQVVTVAADLGPVTGLAVDPDGTTVVVTYSSDIGTIPTSLMACFRRNPDGSFRCRPETHNVPGPNGWLTPVLPWGVERLVGFSDGHDLLVIDAASGMLWQQRSTMSGLASTPSTALLLSAGTASSPPESRLVVVTHDGPRWIVLSARGELLHETEFHWQPGIPASSSLASMPISWRFVPPLLELLGLDANGAIYAARFHAEEGKLELLSAQVATTQGGYLTTARVGTTKLVAVSAQRVDWLDCAAEKLHAVHKLDVGFPTAVACFPSRSTQETLVVCSDGFVARVTASRRSIPAK